MTQDTKTDWKLSLKMLGPGLLFAGAAIGVSHLVWATRAGADFGLGLIWAVLIVHLFKYPFFEFGPRYAAATGENLLQGYRKLGRGVLFLLILMTIGTMFTIQAAVTIVTAGLAMGLFNVGLGIFHWSCIILLICVSILSIGRYNLLDKTMKVVILTLTISTLFAVLFSFGKSNPHLSFEPVFPFYDGGIIFLIALMGWMPAPIDLSVWHSLWAIEKEKNTKAHFGVKKALFDFNIGYVGTMILAFCFLLLGAIVMYDGTAGKFSSKGGEFAGQLISLYTTSLGDWAKWIIGIATFTTMFSTTLTCLDALPRTMSAATKELKSIAQQELKLDAKAYYWPWMILLLVGTLLILGLLVSSMGLMVKIATILSFMTAPFFAIANYKLVTSSFMPIAHHPSKRMKILSGFGICFLIGFCILYLLSLLKLIG